MALGRGREAQGASKAGGAAASRGSQGLWEAAGPLPGGRGQEPPASLRGGPAGVPGGRGPSRARGPRPLLLGSGSHPPAGEPVSLEPLHVVASVAATVLSPFPRLRGPSLAHTAQPPGIQLWPNKLSSQTAVAGPAAYACFQL